MKPSLIPGHDTSPTPANDVSPRAAENASLLQRGDVSLAAAGDGRKCGWCRGRILETAKSSSVFCSKNCRQTAFRLRRRVLAMERDGEPKRIAYADPPYPGMAKRFYQHEASYAGEVDHQALIQSLVDGYDGWALSTSAAALKETKILEWCPKGIRICPWIKANGPHPDTRGIHNLWEPLIVFEARREKPGKRDYLIAKPARGGGDLPGRKPIAFCAWMFGLIGMHPGDSFVDLFPGSGVVGRSWAQASRNAGVDASPEPGRDTSPTAERDAIPSK